MDALARAVAEADAEFAAAMESGLESRFRRAASMYEDITREYALDNRHVDSYFSAAYIYMEYLQDPADFEQASNLLSIVISDYPGDYELIADALTTRAHLEYRCLRDYRSSKDDLARILNERLLRDSLGDDRTVDVKVLYAKCCQKLGDYQNAKMAWEEVVFSNPERDTEGRLQWIKDSTTWLLINSGDIRLFFEAGIDQPTYSDCLLKIRDGLREAGETWGISTSAPLDVYLYATGDHLFDYTLRRKAFAIPSDSEIHMAVSDIPKAEYLAGWVAAQVINTRPDAAVFPLLRAGFDNYFLDNRGGIDALAAKEIYFYGGNVSVDVVVFPLSFDYTFSDEYINMASSFMHFLVEDEGMNVADLQRFYRHLAARPQQVIQPPLMTELLRGAIQSEMKSWQQTILTPAQVTGLFQTVLGIDLSAELASWQEGLSDELAAMEAELGSYSAEIRHVEIDLSTPENALRSWWEAYRAGDLDGLISASTNEVASALSDLKDMWVEQGILEKVILEDFILPYRSANMVVVQQAAFGDSIRVFEVEIERGTEVQQMTIVVRKESNLWRIDSN
jgi:hypothetical protein